MLFVISINSHTHLISICFSDKMFTHCPFLNWVILLLLNFQVFKKILIIHPLLNVCFVNFSSSLWLVFSLYNSLLKKLDFKFWLSFISFKNSFLKIFYMRKCCLIQSTMHLFPLCLLPKGLLVEILLLGL